MMARSESSIIKLMYSIVNIVFSRVVHGRLNEEKVRNREVDPQATCKRAGDAQDVKAEIPPSLEAVRGSTYPFMTRSKDFRAVRAKRVCVLTFSGRPRSPWEDCGLLFQLFHGT